MGRFVDVIRAVFKTERRQSAVFTLTLFAVGWGLTATYFHSLFPISEPLFQNIAALVIGTFWVERLFTPPRDALANAFAGLALTLSLLRDRTYIPPLLTGLTIYYAIVLVSALHATFHQRISSVRRRAVTAKAPPLASTSQPSPWNGLSTCSGFLVRRGSTTPA